jgi:hypothetical protein
VNFYVKYPELPNNAAQSLPTAHTNSQEPEKTEVSTGATASTEGATQVTQKPGYELAIKILKERKRNGNN